MYNLIIMKKEKLELLLNKVVEFNKPDAVNFKGFLYKDSKGYYIKVVETISGTDVVEKDILYLKEGEEQYIIHADKPKLMRVDKNSWHYNLVKFVLCSNAPTPQTMQNGCPYFWLLVFSMFACSFIVIWKVLKFIVLLFPKGFMWCLEKSVENWLKSIDDITAYEMYENRYTNRKNVQKLPLTAKIFFDNKDESFFNYFLTIKYGEGAKYDTVKKDEIHTNWEAWREEVRTERQKHDAQRYAREAEEYRLEALREAKMRENKIKWDARIKPYVDAKNKFFVSLKEAFRFKGDVKVLITRTKQIIGALITIILVAAAFIVVECLALVLMFVIDLCISNWFVFVIIGVLAVCAGIGYILVVFIGGWLQNIVNKYKGGKKVWYIEPIIWFIWYPVKYITLAIGYSIFYVIGKPLQFIFYNFLWKIVLVNLYEFLWKILCSIGRGLVTSTGVFGEYFHADYTGLCPGLEWTGFDEEVKKEKK